MAEHDSGLTTVLERLAESGQAAARPQPPALLRQTADRRTRRRRVFVAGALVLAVVGGATLLGGDRTTRTEKSPFPAGQPTAPAPTQSQTSPKTEAAVPDQALLSPEDPAIRDILGKAQGTVPKVAKIPSLDPRCQIPYQDKARGTVAVRTPQIVGSGGSAIVVEFVTRYVNEEAARDAVAAAVQAIGSCPKAKQLPGAQHVLKVTAFRADTALAWSGRFDDPGRPGKVKVTNRHRAVVRFGDLVAYLMIDSLNKNLTDGQARAIVLAAAERLRDVNG